MRSQGTNRQESSPPGNAAFALKPSGDWVNCPACKRRYRATATARKTGQLHCPDCGHDRLIEQSAEGSDTEMKEGSCIDSIFSERSEMLGLLRDEARFSNSMRRSTRLRPDAPTNSPVLESKHRKEGTKAGGIHAASILVGIMAALWLAFEFNDQIAERLPAAAPAIEAFGNAASDLVGRLTELTEKARNRSQ